VIADPPQKTGHDLEWNSGGSAADQPVLASADPAVLAAPPSAVSVRMLATAADRLDGPTYFVINGNRRLNPAALVVGHVVSGYEAKRLGWSTAMVNALSNTRPERMDHSLRSGGRLGASIQQGWRPAPVRHIDTASRW
jgi:hypothetical protein